MPAASLAAATNCCVAVVAIVDGLGVTVIISIGPVMTTSWSLHAPNVLALGPLQPSVRSCNDSPIAPDPFSKTPMSVDCVPEAGPFFALNFPS